MRIILMHNPKAGRGNHGKKELTAALANAGHHAIYESTKNSDYKKALEKSVDLVLAAGGDGTVGKVGRELIDSCMTIPPVNGRWTSTARHFG
jgi:diacylglycerol kinase family enzyme